MITTKKYNLITLSKNFMVYSFILNEISFITDTQKLKKELIKEINEFIKNPKLTIYPKEIIILVIQIMYKIIIDKLSILKISIEENMQDIYKFSETNSNYQLLEKILKKYKHYAYYDLGNFLDLINNFYPQLYTIFGNNKDQFNNWVINWNQLNLKNSQNKLLIQDDKQQSIIRKITIHELLNSKTGFYIFLVVTAFTFFLYVITICKLKYQLNVY